MTRTLALAALLVGCGTESTDLTDAPCLLSEMTVRPTTLDFGQVQLGHPETRDVEVRNTGCFPFKLLKLDVQQGTSPGFSVVEDIEEQDILVSQAVTITFQYNPVVQGDALGRIDVVSDIRLRGTQTIEMTATGY